MFASIRKHQKWLLILIIIVVVISFVIMFSPNVDLDLFAARQNYGTIDGRAVKSDEFMDSMWEAYLACYFQFGRWPDQMGDFYDVDQEARDRIVLNRRVDELGIHVDDETVANWIERTFGGATEEGFQVELLDNFLAGIDRQKGIKRDDFFRFLRNRIALGHLNEVVGVPGSLLGPEEAKKAYISQNMQATASAILFSTSNHIAKLTMDSLALGQYFTNNMATYRIPEQRTVSFVRFSATNFVAKAEEALVAVTNMAQKIDLAYVARAETLLDDDGEKLPEDKAKERIKEGFRDDEAWKIAQNSAADFVEQLFEETDAENLEILENLAAAEGFIVELTSPFNSRTTPKEVSGFSEFRATAFKLSTENPFSSLIRDPLGKAAYVMALRETIPSSNPKLDAVRVRVESAYRRFKLAEMTREEGEAFHAKITAGMQQGKTFDDIVAEEGVEVLTLPVFNKKDTTLPNWDRRLYLFQVISQVFGRQGAGMRPGDVSAYTTSESGGFIVYLQALNPAAEEDQEELEEVATNMRNQRSAQAANAWMQKEIDKAIPANQLR